MKNSYSFFKNFECEFFPCHKVDDVNKFNCLFCYCPLYNITDCGGNYTLTEIGVKDCSGCVLPHKTENYEYIIRKLNK